MRDAWRRLQQLWRPTIDDGGWSSIWWIERESTVVGALVYEGIDGFWGRFRVVAFLPEVEEPAFWAPENTDVMWVNAWTGLADDLTFPGLDAAREVGPVRRVSMRSLCPPRVVPCGSTAARDRDRRERFAVWVSSQPIGAVTPRGS